MDSSDVFELHGCTTSGEYLQTGGRGIWENVSGGNSGLTFNVKAGANNGAILQMFNSAWVGDIDADQNGNITPGEVVIIEMINSQARNGTCTLIAAGGNIPSIDGAYGALPENVVLTGSSAVEF